MLDLFIAHDLSQRRMRDRLEMGARFEGKAQGAGQEQWRRPGTVSALGDTVPLQRLPFGRSLTRMRHFVVRRRSTTRTAAEC